MIRPPPRSTRTDTLFPYTTLFRSVLLQGTSQRRGDPARRDRIDADTVLGISQRQRFGQLRHPALACRIGGHQRAAKERSEEHTSELQSLMRISYAVFCLKKKKKNNT